MPDLIDGRYELLEVLASGGMATVWRAHDTRLDRMVALKRPHPAPPDDPVHARIEREARAAASLTHPHLVTIYDVGRDETGPYLVMELVEGPTLADSRDGIDRPEAMELVGHLADALAVVHAAGIVHRDVKPANVLMSERGPRLTDFGIALAADSTQRLTQEGTLVATPSYASPEQLAGRPATPSSDVFSLGVMLYELVTGRLPFAGTDRSGPPSPTGDPQLDSLFSRVLSPDPDQRPGAEEMAASLRAAAPTTVMATPGGTTMQMETPVPRPEPEPAPSRAGGRPVLLAGVALLALAALAGALASVSNDDDPAPVTSEAAATSTTDTTAPTTTVAPTTTIAPTTAPPGDGDDDVVEARRRLEATLSEAHPSDLNRADMRKLMEKVDEAIEKADDGDEKGAGKKLREVAKKIDDELEGEVRHRSLEALVGLAEAVGLSLEPDDDEDD